MAEDTGGLGRIDGQHASTVPWSSAGGGVGVSHCAPVDAVAVPSERPPSAAFASFFRQKWSLSDHFCRKNDDGVSSCSSIAPMAG